MHLSHTWCNCGNIITMQSALPKNLSQINYREDYIKISHRHLSTAQNDNLHNKNLAEIEFSTLLTYLIKRLIVEYSL